MIMIILFFEKLIFLLLTQFGLGRGGGGKMVPMRAFAKYLKNGLTDLHQTF